MMNLEESLKELKLKRSMLQQAESFDDISKLWKEIKKLHADCSSFLVDINKNIEALENGNNSIEAQNIEKFSHALDEINEIAKKIETEPLDKVCNLMQRMQELKLFCINKLEEQKNQVEEVK